LPQSVMEFDRYPSLMSEERDTIDTWRELRKAGRPGTVNYREAKGHKGFVLFQKRERAVPGMESFDLFIHFVYVPPEFRRQGVGRSLIEGLGKKKMAGVCVCVDDDGFWKSLGWHEDGIFVYSK
jgi:GNAT superfamily N-acetyltransferase